MDETKHGWKAGLPSGTPQEPHRCNCQVHRSTNTEEAEHFDFREWKLSLCIARNVLRGSEQQLSSNDKSNVRPKMCKHRRATPPKGPSKSYTPWRRLTSPPSKAHSSKSTVPRTSLTRPPPGQEKTQKGQHTNGVGDTGESQFSGWPPHLSDPDAPCTILTGAAGTPDARGSVHQQR